MCRSLPRCRPSRRAPAPADTVAGTLTPDPTPRTSIAAEPKPADDNPSSARGGSEPGGRDALPSSPTESVPAGPPSTRWSITGSTDARPPITGSSTASAATLILCRSPGRPGGCSPLAADRIVAGPGPPPVPRWPLGPRPPSSRPSPSGPPNARPPAPAAVATDRGLRAGVPPSSACTPARNRNGVAASSSAVNSGPGADGRSVTGSGAVASGVVTGPLDLFGEMRHVASTPAARHLHDLPLTPVVVRGQVMDLLAQQPLVDPQLAEQEALDLEGH